MTASKIGTAFAQAYTERLQSGQADSGALQQLYAPEASLTLNGNRVEGSQKIAQALVESFTSGAKRKVYGVDSQELHTGGVLVSFRGEVAEPPMPFSETFVLVPVTGSHVVTNHIFNIITSN
ncbi:ketosteroid isomerase family protein [Streptomyces sp. IBSNAI002]|uniref:ketosteroid isomerase family protein n=1 Tax=Streptomyces sp. IBSNAI002 TaxID=3457500 RepID=UPI003FD02136